MTQHLTEGSLTGLHDKHIASGKVREMFAIGDDHVLIVATDRISAYDFILPTEIPDKGAVLTAMTLWWLEQLADVVPNHLVAANVADYPAELQPYADALRGRSMLCRKLDMFPVECVARGYLAGSGWTDYSTTGLVCGHQLPDGLQDGSPLPEPIFTPATKADTGHDANISVALAGEIVGPDVVRELERLTLALYVRAVGLARERGILIADTKVEFGFDEGKTIVLGDEVLTPDSSRFWPAGTWKPGGPQPSYDKQYVRDWLTSPASGWDRHGDVPPPSLPEDVVVRTREKYVEAYEALTGRSFADYLAGV
jgi:phosphoribosylaminoimidazole-succinocarboxamide synthase